MVDKHHETQEQSIKARKHQLFDSDAPVAVGSGRRFKEFLRTTPAAPLSGLTRAVLWVAGAVVALVLVAALFKTFNRPPKVVPRPARTAARLAGPSAGLDCLASVRWNRGGWDGPRAPPSIDLVDGAEHDYALDRTG